VLLHGRVAALVNSWVVKSFEFGFVDMSLVQVLEGVALTIDLSQIVESSNRSRLQLFQVQGG